MKKKKVETEVERGVFDRRTAGNECGLKEVGWEEIQGRRTSIVHGSDSRATKGMERNGARCDSSQGEKRMEMRRRRVIAKEMESGNEERTGGKGQTLGESRGPEHDVDGFHTLYRDCWDGSW